MALNNITRTNTIDEWRIQTNLAANALNQIETGNYNKTNGTFTISSNGVLSITAQGTSLSVANGALFQSNISVGKDIVLGSEASQTGNLSVGNSVYIYGGATALFVANNVIANGSLLVRNTITTNNVTVNSNVVVVGTANAGYLGVANSGYVGTTLTVIGNTAVGNLTTANSVVADNGRFTSNLTASHFVSVAGSIVADSARITANANVAHLNATNSINANSAAITANVTATEATLTTINATNARISGNANVAHLTASDSVVADKGSFTNNVIVGHVIANTGSVVANNARFNANTSVGQELTTITVNATNSRVSGNANAAHFTAATGSVVADSLRITSATSSANISGNVVAGNVNTQGMVHAGSLVSGKTDVGSLSATSLSTASDATVGGKLTVQGDFVLSGDIVYDTDALSISTITPVTDTGAAYFGVFRGNDKGGVSGGSGGATANANAYIRWSASANNWQIRDVFNSDLTTTYSKILTANLITTSTASVSNADFASSWLMKNYVDNANTNLKSYVDTSAIQTAAANAGLLGINLSANIGAARIADTANSGLGDIIVMGRANGAFGLANLASNTFNGTTGSAAPSNGVISFTSTNGVTLVGAANTITVNTPQDVRTTASPTFSALTLTTALPLAQGGTGATSASGALTNILPAGGTAGFVLATSGSGTYYWAAGGTGGGGSATPGTTITSTRTTPTVNASQRIFATPIYQIGTGQLRVFINGVRQFASEYTEGANNLTGVASVSSNGYFSTTSVTSTLVQDAALAIDGTLTGTATISAYVPGKIYYIKTILGNHFSLSETVGGAAITTTAGTTTGLSFTTGHNVTLSTGASSGDAILLEVDAYTVNPYFANNIAYGPVTGEIAASANTIQLAIDSLESRKITTTAAQANVGAGLISVTNAYQANVGAGRISDVTTLQANTGALSIGLTNEITGRQANVGAAVISVTNAYQANVGAGLLSTSTSLTSAYQANTGAALIIARNADNLSSGTVPSARLSGSYTGITGVGTLTVGSIPYATSAGSATNASAATNATYATSAGSATNASTATNATYATSAGSATNATYATSAGSATNASTATNATYATTAGSATYASSAGRVDSAGFWGDKSSYGFAGYHLSFANPARIDYNDTWLSYSDSINVPVAGWYHFTNISPYFKMLKYGSISHSAVSFIAVSVEAYVDSIWSPLTISYFSYSDLFNSASVTSGTWYRMYRAYRFWSYNGAYNDGVHPWALPLNHQPMYIPSGNHVRVLVRGITDTNPTITSPYSGAPSNDYLDGRNGSTASFFNDTAIGQRMVLPAAYNGAYSLYTYAGPDWTASYVGGGASISAVRVG
jgi:hypothetical protein